MRYPKFLPDGGTVGFAAPSFGCNMEPYRSCFDAALRFWQKEGYQVLLGENVYAGDGIGISSSPENCGRELTDAYTTQESDILISCGGGELMCETMDHVDFNRIKAAEPKWFMGYSDNTNMTFLLATVCDTAAVYGPCAPAFGMQPQHEAVKDAYALLRGEKLWSKGYAHYEVESLKSEENPFAPYNAVKKRCIRTWTADDGLASEDQSVQVDMQGRLLGGCLDCLVNLVGTQFDQVAAFNERYAADGVIWVLEACDLNVYSIRRALWHMDRAGWFQHVKGFMIGRPLNGDEMFGLDHVQAVTGILGKYGVPVLFDLDIGHLPPMMPLIMGSVAQVSCTGQDFRLEMQLK